MCSFGFGHPLKTAATKNLDFALSTHWHPVLTTSLLKLVFSFYFQCSL